MLSQAISFPDGGYLMWKVEWNASGVHADVSHVTQQDISFIRLPLSAKHVVFNRRRNDPNTEDQEHLWRIGKCAPDIVLEPCKPVNTEWGTFLDNDFPPATEHLVLLPVHALYYPETSAIATSKLPATEDTADQHLYKMHMLVVQWKSPKTVEFSAKDWGW
jgi:hypothetical protein